MRRLTSRGVERVASRKLRVLILRIGSDSGPGECERASREGSRTGNNDRERLSESDAGQNDDGATCLVNGFAPRMSSKVRNA